MRLTPSFAEYPAGVISAMGRKARKVIWSYGPAFFSKPCERRAPSRQLLMGSLSADEARTRTGALSNVGRYTDDMNSPNNVLQNLLGAFVGPVLSVQSHSPATHCP